MDYPSYNGYDDELIPEWTQKGQITMRIFNTDKPVEVGQRFDYEDATYQVTRVEGGVFFASKVVNDKVKKGRPSRFTLNVVPTETPA